MVHELETTPKKLEILAKKGITTKEDLLYLLPRKYNDFTNIYREVLPVHAEQSGCFIGKLVKLTKSQTANNCTMVKFTLITGNNQFVTVKFFGKAFMFKYLENFKNTVIAVAGTLHYDNADGFSISEPAHVVPEYSVRKISKIEPVYTKFTGISEDYLVGLIDDAIEHCEEPEIDEDLKYKYRITTLPTTKEAFRILHHPVSTDMMKATQRIVVNDMLKFAIDLEKNGREESKGTHIILKTLKVTNDIIKNLPYTLTKDQQTYYEKMISDIRAGKRVSALLQGDVSCGKTLVATLMLFAVAENGYQGVLMAPTAILAKQHFEQIKVLADKYGIKAAYYDGKLSASAKKKICQSISNGETKIIIGTQALTTGAIELNNPGMVIIDEEHRYGVEQRHALLKEAQRGVNTLLMSATPMPRTLASSLHSSNIQIYDIRTMPSCRKPIQTAICNNDKVIFGFIEKELRAGRQAYVVCPLIKKGEDSSELMKDVLSVEETTKIYKERFEPEFKVAAISGKMKEEEMESILDEYKKGEIHILVSTTVIEVGVNVPNASVIVISNAERFGLQAMHQLRGRVGRGEYKSYCILKSKDKENERLLTMVSCSDGFAIADKDLDLRGPGELVGVKQSGFSKYIDLAIKYPKLYNIIKSMAIEIVDRS